LPVYEPAPLDQWVIGFQYFGGISNWDNPLFPSGCPSSSPVKANLANPGWVLGSDTTIKCNGTWGGTELGREFVYQNMPSHSANHVPDGGTEVFMDGSAHWIKAQTMYFLHSWDPSSGAKICYFWQDPNTFDTATAAAMTPSALNTLKFRP
jgi:hypothetical protein